MRFLMRLWECLTVWNLTPTSLQGAQAILAHAAGENSPTDPGLVNDYLGSLVRNLYHQLHIPVIVQGELANCLKEIPLEAKSLRQSESSTYLTSRDIAQWQKSECYKRGIRCIVLVSYYPHFCRGMWVTEKLGLKVLVPPGLKEVYDPGNSQWWARNKFLNRPYELLIRLYFLWRGWI